MLVTLAKPATVSAMMVDERLAARHSKNLKCISGGESKKRGDEKDPRDPGLRSGLGIEG